MSFLVGLSAVTSLHVHTYQEHQQVSSEAVCFLNPCMHWSAWWTWCAHHFHQHRYWVHTQFRRLMYEATCIPDSSTGWKFSIFCKDKRMSPHELCLSVFRVHVGEQNTPQDLKMLMWSTTAHRSLRLDNQLVNASVASDTARYCHRSDAQQYIWKWCMDLQGDIFGASSANLRKLKDKQQLAVCLPAPTDQLAWQEKCCQ